MIDRDKVLEAFLKGELIPRYKVSQAMRELTMDVKALVMAVPGRIAPELEGLPKAEIEARLTAALQKALKDVAFKQLTDFTNPSGGGH
jgi:hypothetical protein